MKVVAPKCAMSVREPALEQYSKNVCPPVKFCRFSMLRMVREGIAPQREDVKQLPRKS